MGQRRTISCRDFIARVKLLAHQGFPWVGRAHAPSPDVRYGPLGRTNFLGGNVRQKGSHIRFEHADGRKTTIPDHGSEDVPVGLMNKIIRHDLEMSVDDFFAED
jgi:hypothetical protein